MATPLDFGRQVLSVEAHALDLVRQRLDNQFQRAVEWVVGCKGHIIVTGVGKPWFVAQKISATFASTGTPSFPLHPSDAMHGDIGRVQADDIVLALSNSGESDELVRLIPMIKQFGAGLIAVTGHAQSALGREATICIAYGRLDEACPLGLAPSASSTAMLAVGDALALAVANARQFTAQDFAKFHPAGALGRKLLRVKEIMRGKDRTPLLPSQATVAAVLEAITKLRAGAALIVAPNGVLLGIFTDGDLRRHLARDPRLLQAEVGAHMTRQPKTIGPDHLVAEALRLMRSHRIDELPVIDDAGVAIGHLDVQDLLDVRVEPTDTT